MTFRMHLIFEEKSYDQNKMANPLLFCFLLCTFSSVYGQMLGGWSAADVNSDSVQNAAKFATSTIEAQSNSMWRNRFMKVLHAQTQVGSS